MQSFEVISGPDDLPQRQVSARGDLDIATASELLAVVRDVLTQPGATRLRLDLGGVTFLDSMGLSALVQIHHTAAELGGLDISGSSTAVQQVLRLTGLADMFGLPPESSGGPAEP